MVEENSAACEHPVAFAVVHGNVVAEHLGAGIRTTGVERSILVLWRPHRTKHLAGRGMIETRLDAGLPDRLQEPKRAGTDYVDGVFGNVETHPHMALCGEVIHLVRPYDIQQLRYAAGGSHIGKMQEKSAAVLMQVRIDAIYPPRIKAAGTALESMHFVSLPQQELSKIRTVLASYAGDQRLLHDYSFSPSAAPDATADRYVAGVSPRTGEQIRLEWPPHTDLGNGSGTARDVILHRWVPVMRHRSGVPQHGSFFRKKHLCNEYTSRYYAD